MGQFQEDVVKLEEDFFLFWLAFDSVGHEVSDNKAVGV